MVMLMLFSRHPAFPKEDAMDPFSNDQTPYPESMGYWTPGCPQCEEYEASYERWLRDTGTMRGRAQAWCGLCKKWVRN
jgi:hypothetical protein